MWELGSILSSNGIDIEQIPKLSHFLSCLYFSLWHLIIVIFYWLNVLHVLPVASVCKVLHSFSSLVRFRPVGIKVGPQPSSTFFLLWGLIFFRFILRVAESFVLWILDLLLFNVIQSHKGVGTLRVEWRVFLLNKSLSMSNLR